MTTCTSSKSILVDLLETFKTKGISHDPKRGLDKLQGVKGLLKKYAAEA